MQRIAFALALAGAAAAATAVAACDAQAVSPGEPGMSPNTQLVRFSSDALGVEKRFAIYLPADYATAPNKRYPVFYYLHGFGGDEESWTLGAGLDAAADAMHLEAIIVMPDGDDSFYVDARANGDYDDCMETGAGLADASERRATTCVRDRKYETYIIHDLIGYVDSHYRTIQSRDGRALAGFSMGGYGALELAGRHPDLFAAAASHSGVVSLFYVGPHPYNPAAPPQLIADVKDEPSEWKRGLFGTDRSFWDAHDPVTLLTQLPPGKVALYIDCGTEDDLQLDAQASYLHDQLQRKHVDHVFVLDHGHHDFNFVRKREPYSLAFLRDHTSAAK